MDAILSLFNELQVLLEELHAVVEGASSFFEVVGAITTALATIATLITTLITAIASIVTFITAAIGVIGTLLLAVLLILALLASHIFCAIPTFVLARRANSKIAWLAWLPLPYIKAFVQCDIAGKEPLKIFGRTLALKNRMLGCFIATLVSLFGTTILNIIINLALITVANVFPGVGQLASIIFTIVAFIPVAVVSYYNFLSLRDIHDCFREDGSGLSLALVATLVDDLVLQAPLVRTITMYSLLRKKKVSNNDPLVVEAEPCVPQAEE